jgi:hypothetical protein
MNATTSERDFMIQRVLMLGIGLILIMVYLQLALSVGSGSGDSTSNWRPEMRLLPNMRAALYSSNSGMGAVISGNGQIWLINVPIVFFIGIFIMLCHMSNIRDNSRYISRQWSGVSYNTGVQSSGVQEVLVKASRGNPGTGINVYRGFLPWSAGGASRRAYDYYHYYRD